MSLWSRIERRVSDLAGEILLDEFREQIAQARALLEKGEEEAAQTAVDVLQALLADRPDHRQAWVLLGVAKLRMRSAAAALTAFDNALKGRGDDPTALLGHGQALLLLGDFTQAIASLTRAVSEAGGDRGLLADAYQGLGIAWRRLGDTDKAVRELRKAVAEAPTDADARAALGEALLADAGVTDEVRRHLEKAVEGGQGPPVAYMALGLVALADGAPALASEQFARARAELEGDDTALGRLIRLDVLVGLGDAALAAADPARAQRYFAEALQLDPRQARNHARAAHAHRSAGELQEAISSFESALGLFGSSVDVGVLRSAVETATAAGDWERQARWGNDLLAAAPDDADALMARGMAMAHAGQHGAARGLLSTAWKANHVGAALALGQFALDDGDVETALARARESMRASPRSEPARQLLAKAQRHRQRLAGFGDEVVAAPADAMPRLAAFMEDIVTRRAELAKLAGDASRAAADLDQPLLVTVMGEFSSGKSSFVNAFIGADVAATGITPTTATINVVRFGRERGGRLVDHAGNVVELGWEALCEKLRTLTADDARQLDRVEILLPLPQLSTVNIVDTPGLNSISPEHEQTARAFIARADAVVWVFTASQGGKSSERKALESIRDEGRRVLGVLNKSDQLSTDETREVTDFIQQSLAGLVEEVVPFSARRALAWKTKHADTKAGPGATPNANVGADTDDGNWQALATALENRFFSHARQLKRDACARRLRLIATTARDLMHQRRANTAAVVARATAVSDELHEQALVFVDHTVTVERRAFAEAATALYRRAAAEVVALVQPRRMPWTQHVATPADRDYLIALLDAGFEASMAAGRARVQAVLASHLRLARSSSADVATVTGADVDGDLARLGADRAQLALAQVFDRARAYLSGYVAGGYVDSFLRNDVPRVDGSADAAYHALLRAAPDLDRQIALPLAKSGAEAITALAERVAHWAAVAEAIVYDLDVSLLQPLDLVLAQL